ncbi:MAG TPA: hypothetical protein VKD00_04795 [Methyloceanibacter sp.]|nr:hypothetical protein [Methyloceanibacter sp.]
MDKLVRRVTVIQGSGEHRQANVVYNSEDGDDENHETPQFKGLERSVRHLLKAQVIAAQEAYQRHLESVEKGGNAWLVDDALNMMGARRKAMKEALKASPFKLMKFEADEDEGEDEGE